MNDVTNSIDDVLSQYNQADIDDKLVEMAQLPEKYAIKDLTPVLKRSIRDTNIKNTILSKANQALKQYSESLLELSNATSKEELIRASLGISDSLQKINRHYQSYTGAAEHLITKDGTLKAGDIIADISGYFLEQERIKVLKRFISVSDTPVQKIGSILLQQLQKGIITKRLYTIENNKLAGDFSDYNDNIRDMSYSKRKELLSQFYQRYLKMQSIKGKMDSIQSSVISILTAHKKLKIELERDNYWSEEISSLLKNVRRFNKNRNGFYSVIYNCSGQMELVPQVGLMCKQGISQLNQHQNQ